MHQIKGQTSSRTLFVFDFRRTDSDQKGLYGVYAKNS